MAHFRIDRSLSQLVRSFVRFISLRFYQTRACTFIVLVAFKKSLLISVIILLLLFHSFPFLSSFNARSKLSIAPLGGPVQSPNPFFVFVFFFVAW